MPVACIGCVLNIKSLYYLREIGVVLAPALLPAGPLGGGCTGVFFSQSFALEIYHFIPPIGGAFHSLIFVAFGYVVSLYCLWRESGV